MCASASAAAAAARRSGAPCIVWNYPGRSPKLLGRADPQRRGGLCRAAQDLLAGPSVIGIGRSTSTRRTSTRMPILAWLVGARPALLGRLAFPGCRQAVVLRALSVKRGQVRLWPYARATARHHRCPAAAAGRGPSAADLLWDGAPYHRAEAVREVAATLQIVLVPLPSYSPDLMPVEALGAGCARTSPITTAMPAPTTSPGG